MNTEIHISVIMIFLNGERYIDEAVESIFAQTYPHWELIFVDDGSTDRSSAIARRYAEQHPERVRYAEHPNHENRGMSASRNLGASLARGSMIAFLDADDVYLPQKLEQQAAILEHHPEVGMVYGPTLHWFSWTGQPADQTRDFLRKLGVPADTYVEPPGLLQRYLEHRAWTPGTCGVLIRRAAFAQVGGFEERFRGMFEDQAFFYKLALQVPIYVEGGSWDRYRQHPESWCETSRASGTWRPDRRPNPSRRIFLDWLQHYLSEQHVSDPQLWEALRRERWPYEHPLLYQLSTLSQRAGQHARRLLGSNH
jgi:glycosyltransferase involved in cell wall biosynthesis